MVQKLSAACAMSFGGCRQLLYFLSASIIIRFSTIGAVLYLDPAFRRIRFFAVGATHFKPHISYGSDKQNASNQKHSCVNNKWNSLGFISSHPYYKKIEQLKNNSNNINCLFLNVIIKSILHYVVQYPNCIAVSGCCKVTF